MKKFYKRALDAAETARREIAKIDEDFEREKEYIDECFSSGMLTPAGKKMKLDEAAEKRKERIETAVLPVEELRQEFACDMQDASRIDGGQIDESTMRLLNSGVKLSTGEWQRMIDDNKDNATMLRIIKQKYDERPIEKKSAQESLLINRQRTSEKPVVFPVSPNEKARAFDSFCGIISRGAVSGAKLNEFPTQSDYWNSIARENLNKLGEPVADDEFYYESYAKPKPTVW